MSTPKKPFPAWVCGPCGRKYGSHPEGHLSTWHYETCGVCGEENVYVTEPRDFRHLPNLPADYER